MELLSDGFMRYFSLEMANDRLQKDRAFWIRYRVYCKEFGYEPEERFPDQLETDEYDEASQHCLITHIATGAPAGCVRMVPAMGSQETMPLPLERYCAATLDKDLVGKLSGDRNNVCEISRLAVDTAFRRREGEFLSRYGEVEGCVFSDQERRTFSLVAVALFLAANVMAEKYQRNNIFAMMEPFLPRMMFKVGIHFQKVGGEINFHGIRAPYFLDGPSVPRNLPSDYKDLYAWVRKSIMS
jgi:N-acyl amino acid synthase of PEP-CTERM/exosortase system